MLGKQLIEGSAEERPFHGSAKTKLAEIPGPGSWST